MEKGEITSLSNFLLPSNDFEHYNTSAEEGIFPNVNQINSNVAPSYDPEYDYYNEYSTTPLVYSWMPIVPGFSQDGTDNLQNFDHVMKRLKPQPLNVSNIDPNKLNDSTLINNSANYHFQRLELLDATAATVTINKDLSSTTFSHQLEDSCNAMDLNISCHAAASSSVIESSNLNIDLSFNGKISEMNSTTIHNDDNNKKEEEKFEYPNQFEVLSPNKSKEEDENEEERIRNESFELLKKEDSSKMILVNEKSPEVVEDNDDDDEETDEVQDLPIEIPKTEDLLEISTETKSLIDCDTFIFNRLHNSLSEHCPPPSIKALPLSLSEMLATYKQNLDKEPVSAINSSSLFIPSHPLTEVLTTEWPQLAEIKAHGIMYNRSTNCEEIELMRLRYTDKFVRAETTSSYTHKNGPTSAKKRIEKLKCLAQSPGRRLSHLANRRKIFSSANLKSTSINASHKSLGAGFLIDKT